MNGRCALSMTRLALLVALVAWSHESSRSVAVAQTPAPKSTSSNLTPPKPSSSLDEELLNDLLPSPSKPAKPATPEKKAPDSVPPENKSSNKSPPTDEEGEDIGDSLASRVRALLTPLRDAADRLEKGDSSVATRQRQQIVVSQMDELLSRRPKPKPATSGSEGATNDRPGSKQIADKMNEGKDQGGKESTGDSEGSRPAEVTPVDATRELWGQLPAHLREQLQGALPERFLPGYETLIEAYYRRIAERRQP